MSRAELYKNMFRDWYVNRLSELKEDMDWLWKNLSADEKAELNSWLPRIVGGQPT